MTRRREPFILMALLLAACGAAGEVPATSTAAPVHDASPSVVPSDANPSVVPSDAMSPTPNMSSPAPAIPSISWSERPFDGDVDAVSVDRGAFVAVGRVAQQLTSWTSQDAIVWQESAVPDPTFLDDAADTFGSTVFELSRMGSIARLGDTLFSFGTFSGYNDSVHPVGWRLSDGGAWEYIESESPFFGECCGLFTVVAGGPGLLAMKHNFAVYSGETWLWTAESSWQETTPIKAADTGTSGTDLLDAVWANDKFIVVGVAAQVDIGGASEEWSTAASSWTSANGRTWQTTPPAAELEGAVMYSVSQAPGATYVAVGCEQCTLGQAGVPAAWTSLDGLTWTRVTMPANTGGVAHRVVPLASGLVAIGTGASGTLTWTSADGSSWQQGPTLDGAAHRHLSFGKALAIRDDEVVLFLTRGENELGRPLETVIATGVVQR